jgi:hypothetical protein
MVQKFGLLGMVHTDRHTCWPRPQMIQYYNTVCGNGRVLQFHKVQGLLAHHIKLNCLHCLDRCEWATTWHRRCEALTAEVRKE